MSTSSDKVAVVEARLPYIDRRALSEAWYSALHVASDRKLRIPMRRSTDAPPPAGQAGPIRSPQGLSGIGSRAGARGCTPRGDAGLPEHSECGRARPATRAAAARFQRARSYPPFEATLTLGLEGARVKVLLRRDGRALRVIALCSPQHVELVRRALGCADAHLRGRGELVLSAVRTLTDGTAR